MQAAALVIEAAQVLEGSGAAVGGALIEVGEAGLQLLNPLAVLIDPWSDRGHGSPQLAGALIKRLGLRHLLAAGLGEAEQGISLLLQLIAAIHLIEQLLLVHHLAAFPRELMLKTLVELVAALLHQACPQLLVVVTGQVLVDRQGL